MKLLLILLVLFSTVALGFQNKTFDFVPPIQNMDGSPLADAEIASYNIFCNDALLGNVLNTGGTNTWTSPDGSLPPGIYQCHATTVRDDGEESDPSNSVNFIVDPSRPEAPTGFSVTLP